MSSNQPPPSPSEPEPRRIPPNESEYEHIKQGDPREGRYLGVDWPEQPGIRLNEEDW